ncbi:hypothetical protein AOA12_22080 (plasmid) [Microbacterium sp. No. 7]|nr:hypothetical protein AOA12_22080 [Microbacterium sp. No. 7]
MSIASSHPQSTSSCTYASGFFGDAGGQVPASCGSCSRMVRTAVSSESGSRRRASISRIRSTTGSGGSRLHPGPSCS